MSLKVSLKSLVSKKLFICTFAAAASMIILFLISPIALIFLLVDFGLVSRSIFGVERIADEARRAFMLTFEAASLSTLLLLISGIPLAYILARYDFKGKSTLESMIDMPFLLPHTVAGIFVLVTYGSRGPIGSLLSSIGIIIEDTYWGIVAAMAFVSAPILVNTVRDGFKSIDPTLEYVARSLGASHARAFLTVSLPLAWRSIITGALLSWARAVSEVGAILIVAYYPKTINVLIIEWFNTYGLAYALALTVPLLFISVLLFATIRAVAGFRE